MISLPISEEVPRYFSQPPTCAEWLYKPNWTQTLFVFTYTEQRVSHVPVRVNPITSLSIPSKYSEPKPLRGFEGSIHRAQMIYIPVYFKVGTFTTIQLFNCLVRSNLTIEILMLQQSLIYFIQLPTHISLRAFIIGCRYFGYQLPKQRNSLH
jgi:hypothetical protein